MARRRAACRLPEGVHHRPKWQLVLDMLEELAGWDLVPPVLGADSGYGEVGCFRWGWTPARFPRWWRSGPTPRPPQSRGTLPLRRMQPRAAVPGRATATAHARWPSSPSKLGSRLGWS
jgi:hypothetical protein